MKHANTHALESIFSQVTAPPAPGPWLWDRWWVERTRGAEDLKLQRTTFPLNHAWAVENEWVGCARTRGAAPPPEVQINPR